MGLLHVVDPAAEIASQLNENRRSALAGAWVAQGRQIRGTSPDEVRGRAS